MKGSPHMSLQAALSHTGFIGTKVSNPPRRQERKHKTRRRVQNIFIIYNTNAPHPNTRHDQARLLEVFARRLQLQERLGLQLCEALVQLLGGGADSSTRKDRGPTQMHQFVWTVAPNRCLFR